MRFLIAGFGSIGRRHLRNLLALGELDVLLYRTRQSTLPEDEIAGIPVETDLDAALRRHPDAVIVANPTALHLPTALSAARAGCHLLIEKPVSNALEGIDELQASLEKNHVQALAGFQFRFHPGLRQAESWLRDGAIGRPLSARAHWGEYLPNWHPWEDYRRSYSARGDLGGGVVLTLSHPLDYLRWLLGEVDGVMAMTGRLGDLELTVEDTAEIGLHFASGCLGSLHLDYNQQPPTHRLEIIGTQGTLRWDNADGAARLYRASAQVWEICPPPEGFERNTLFLDELRHFREVIRGAAQSVCTLADGERALHLALAIHEAAQSGRTVQL
ncbi:MAG TPA: Gfo/Idh/MocA family oxidoreductase [Anaerolineaceae bacterium]|nr:Gfo/Idh/MocA family oxidoreductase [Anaerolineaceae bacterium]